MQIFVRAEVFQLSFIGVALLYIISLGNFNCVLDKTIFTPLGTSQFPGRVRGTFTNLNVGLQGMFSYKPCYGKRWYNVSKWDYFFKKI